MTGSVVRRPSSPVRPLQLNCCRTDQQVLHRDGLMGFGGCTSGLSSDVGGLLRAIFRRLQALLVLLGALELSAGPLEALKRVLTWSPCY